MSWGSWGIKAVFDMSNEVWAGKWPFSCALQPCWRTSSTSVFMYIFYVVEINQYQKESGNCQRMVYHVPFWSKCWPSRKNTRNLRTELVCPEFVSFPCCPCFIAGVVSSINIFHRLLQGWQTPGLGVGFKIHSSQNDRLIQFLNTNSKYEFWKGTPWQHCH